MFALINLIPCAYSTKSYIANNKLKEIINFIVLRSQQEDALNAPISHSACIKDILSKFCIPLNGIPLSHIYHYEKHDDGTIWCSYTCLTAFESNVSNANVVFLCAQSQTLKTIYFEEQANLIEDIIQQKLLNTRTLVTKNIYQQVDELRSSVKNYREQQAPNTPLNQHSLKKLSNIIPLSNVTCRIRKCDLSIVDLVITSPFYTHRTNFVTPPWSRIVPSILHMSNADSLYQHLGYSKQHKKSISKQVTILLYTPHHEKRSKPVSNFWQSVSLRSNHFIWNHEAVRNELALGLLIMISTVSFFSAGFPYLVNEEQMALRIMAQSLLVAASMLVPYLGNQWKSWIEKKQAFFPELGPEHQAYVNRSKSQSVWSGWSIPTSSKNDVTKVPHDTANGTSSREGSEKSSNSPESLRSFSFFSGSQRHPNAATNASKECTILFDPELGQYELQVY